MHPIVVVGEAKPGDVMEGPFVAVPLATWEAVSAASEQVTSLTEKLKQERELNARITQNFQEYMRDHQVLLSQKKAGR
jgi:hypothetical protein